MRDINKHEGCQQNIAGSGFFENLIDKKELAKKLMVSESYVNKLMGFGLPYFKIGRSVRFRLNEVTAWLQLRRQP